MYEILFQVNYHPNEPFLLISGSLDGHMKLFDTRKKEAVTTFIGYITYFYHQMNHLTINIFLTVMQVV